MTPPPKVAGHFTRLIAAPLSRFAAIASLMTAAACGGSMSSTVEAGSSLAPTADMSMSAPSPDPRVGLRGGTVDSSRRNVVQPAAEAIWNLRLVSNTPSATNFKGVTNSDLAFMGKYAIQGNYNGYMVWDISNPRAPQLATSYLCPASQSDVSVYKNLLFVSSEGLTGRKDCGAQGVKDTVSDERVRGIRIFDATDMHNPKYLANVQTCRGSHTHTVVHDPKDSKNVYIYVSGSSSVRSPTELPGCLDGPIDDPSSVLFRIEVIKVPLDHPENAKIVSSPRIFNDLMAPPTHAPPPSDTGGRGGRGGRGGAAPGAAGVAPAARGPRGGPNQCHDITVYPDIGLAGGACGGYGLLLDLSDVANPKRIGAAADSNFSFWHSATFNNDGTKILFTDEWGGGSAPRCRSTDKLEWGADAIFTLSADRKMTMQSYFKMPAAQTVNENCVAHNGSLVPIPGRDIMIQSWYQGGVSLFEWTDPKHPREIGFHDRGPLDATRPGNAGSWSVYWYNGVMVSSEINRGLDIYELVPSYFISQNEIDAAKTYRETYRNVQDQMRMVWPPSFAKAKAFVDQLVRDKGIVAARSSAIMTAILGAERERGGARATALATLASQVDGDAITAADGAKLRMLSAALRELANASR